MAISSYFFNAVLDGQGNYDRIYNSEDVSSYLDKIVGNGVFPTPATQLQVSAANGMAVVVQPGQGWIDGHKIVNSSVLTLDIAASDVLLNRIDAVIFYVDYTAREMGIEVKQGTAAATAVAPSMTRNDTRYEMCLAQVSVAKQVTSITNSMITDTRGIASVCGYVVGLIEQVDAEGLWQQWNDEFTDWFAQVKDTLATVTLLQKLEQVFTTTSASVSSFNVSEYIPSYKYSIDILEIYVNGLRLDDNEYSTYQNTVTLASPITHAGTEVSLVVYKSIDGSDAETIVTQVQEMQSVVDTLETGTYIATGENDNAKLSQVVQTFLNGGNDYRQLELDVYGDLACTTPVATVSGTQYWFNFWAAKSTRRVKLNFAHASRIVVDNTGISNAVLISAADTEIANMQAVMNNCTNAVAIENDSTCTDCAFWLNGMGAGNLVGAYQGTFTNCRISVTNATGKAYGFSGNGNALLLTNCEALAYNASSSSNEAAAVQVQANMTNNVLVMTNCTCPIKARNGYKQSNTVKINSGFYCLTGNMLGAAAAKYSTGDGKTETGTMIVSKSRMLYSSDDV